MVKKNVQIVLTEEEYASVKKKADDVGLSVAHYVKSIILDEDDFTKYYKQLLEMVNALEPGTKFNIRDLFKGKGEWTMSKGIKLNLGKTFYKQFNEGLIKNIDEIGKDTSPIMWYIKK